MPSSGGPTCGRWKMSWSIEFRLTLPLLFLSDSDGRAPRYGFALGQILDYARATGNRELEDLWVRRAKEYFSTTRDYPTRYEPSGQDFFSTGWNEADLSGGSSPGRVFPVAGSLPAALAQGESNPLLQPVAVTDVTDGKLVHLAGLNLSRAWCQNGNRQRARPHGPRRELLQRVAAEHTSAGLKTVFSGHYEGEHWLGTFALYTLTEVRSAESRLDRPHCGSLFRSYSFHDAPAGASVPIPERCRSPAGHSGTGPSPPRRTVPPSVQPAKAS